MKFLKICLAFSLLANASFADSDSKDAHKTFRFESGACIFEVPELFVNPRVARFEENSYKDISQYRFSFFLDTGLPQSEDRRSKPMLRLTDEGGQVRHVISYRYETACPPTPDHKAGSIDVNHYSLEHGVPPQIDVSKYFNIWYSDQLYSGQLFCAPLAGTSVPINGLCQGTITHHTTGVAVNVRFSSDLELLEASENWMRGVRLANTYLNQWHVQK